MIRLHLVVVLGICTFSTLTMAEDNSARVRLLEAENKLLRAQIDALKKRLKTMEATSRPIAPKTKPPTTQPVGPTYLGRKISKARFNSLYKEFAGKVILLGGKYYNVGKPILNRLPSVSETPPNVGDLRDAGGAEVVSVLSKDASILEYRWSYGRVNIGGGRVGSTGIVHRSVVIHVKGIVPRLNVSQNRIANLDVVYVGKFLWRTGWGGGLTVQSYQVLKPLTEEEFTLMLKSGFKLVRYSIRTKPRRVTSRPVR